MLTICTNCSAYIGTECSRLILSTTIWIAGNGRRDWKFVVFIKLLELWKIKGLLYISRINQWLVHNVLYTSFRWHILSWCSHSRNYTFIWNSLALSIKTPAYFYVSDSNNEYSVKKLSLPFQLMLGFFVCKFWSNKTERSKVINIFVCLCFQVLKQTKRRYFLTFVEEVISSLCFREHKVLVKGIKPRTFKYRARTIFLETSLNL